MRYTKEQKQMIQAAILYFKDFNLNNDKAEYDDSNIYIKHFFDMLEFALDKDLFLSHCKTMLEYNLWQTQNPNFITPDPY